MKNGMMGNKPPKLFREIMNFAIMRDILQEIVNEYLSYFNDGSREKIKQVVDNKYFYKSIYDLFLGKYGNHRIAQINVNQFLILLKNLLREGMLSYLMKFVGIGNLELDDIIKMGMNDTYTKNMNRENDSPKQRVEGEFDSMYTSYETQDKGEVSYGNKLAIAKNVIFNGLELKLSLFIRRFDRLFSQVIYRGDFDLGNE